MTGRWLGIDVGTSSLKALLVDDAGVVLARSRQQYAAAPTVRGAEVEQDPEVWITAARAAIAECSADGPPAGVGLTGQVPTLVLAEPNGQAARAAMTWQDNRAVREAEELAAELGPSEPIVGTDLPWSASQLPAKLAWLARHEPGLLAGELVAVQPKDFLGMSLTGAAVSDPWSSKGMVDVRTGRPAPSVLAAAGWPEGVCPPIAPAWHTRGVTRSGALGLPQGIPVSVGTSDALASMLAVGAFGTRRAFVLTGTSDIVGRSVDDDLASGAGLLGIPATAAPGPVLYGPTQSSGATVGWLGRLLGRTVDELLELADQGRDGARLSFVPYLSGERAPLWRPDVRAVLAGVDERDGPAELARAVLLGVALSAAHILGIIAESTGETAPEVHVAGRGADHPTWVRLRLDALGVPIVVHPEPATAALGAAMLGAAAARGTLDGVESMTGSPQRFDPEAAQRESARRMLENYLATSELAQTWERR